MGKVKTKLKQATDGKKTVDRIVLESGAGDKLNHWLQILNQKYDGHIKFFKSDLVDFLICAHEEQLSESELKQIAAENYDELRWVNRCIEKARLSKKDQVSFSFEDMMEARLPIEKLKKSMRKKVDTLNDLMTNKSEPIANQVQSSESKNE